MKQDKNSSIDTPLKNRLDWVTTIIPFVTILALCSLFMIFPDASSLVLGSVRFFLGDQFGSYYLLLGLGALICSLYMAFSRYGRIKLGNLEKPQYSSFQWGSMMFTAGLLPVRVDAIRRRAPYHGHGGHAGLGIHLSPVSLGSYSMELLHHSGCLLRLHAPCAQAEQTKVLRGMPAASGQTCGRYFR